MNDDERTKRPELERTSPNRAWSGVLGAGPEDDRTSPRAAESNTPEHASTLGDAVSRSVEVGYRVIDDYIEQGQDAARRVRQGSYGPDAWAQDVQDLGVRMAQHASDLVGAWMQLVEIAIDAQAPTEPAAAPGAGDSTASERSRDREAATNGASPDPRPSQDEPVGHGARGAGAVPSTQVKLKVASSTTVEVSVDLDSPLVGRAYVVHCLRCSDSTRPRLRDISLAPEEGNGQWVLSVRVPDDHPPGLYRGLILDDDQNLPVGAVSVSIGA